jgi:hypothetical protein
MADVYKFRYSYENGRDHRAGHGFLNSPYPVSRWCPFSRTGPRYCQNCEKIREWYGPLHNPADTKDSTHQSCHAQETCAFTGEEWNPSRFGKRRGRQYYRLPQDRTVQVCQHQHDPAGKKIDEKLFGKEMRVKMWIVISGCPNACTSRMLNEIGIIGRN